MTSIILSLVASTVSTTSAAIIGSGSVQWSGALTSNINWNDVFPGTASGTINGIIVQWRILPVLNMVVSGSGVINLGNMSSTVAASGSVNIELGTNALNGASVTASSASGGLVNTSSGSHVINSLTTDGFADSYKFISSTVGASDSTAPWFVQTANFNAEVNDTAPKTLYTSNRPQNLTNVDDFSLTVTAQPNMQTPAGDYRDRIILTVTGNF
jgi:hypothetical protein